MYSRAPTVASPWRTKDLSHAWPESSRVLACLTVQHLPSALPERCVYYVGFLRAVCVRFQGSSNRLHNRSNLYRRAGLFFAASPAASSASASAPHAPPSTPVPTSRQLVPSDSTPQTGWLLKTELSVEKGTRSWQLWESILVCVQRALAPPRCRCASCYLLL